MNQKWTYCLTEEQYNKLIRSIRKVPMLAEFLDANDDMDFRHLIETHKSVLQKNGMSTPGIRTLLDMLLRRYDLYEKEYQNSHLTDKNVPFDINKVLTWKPRPQWATHMTVGEIDYLDHFIWQADGLPQFLYDDFQARNLFDKVSQYQLILNSTGKNNPELNFTLETIKERFYLLMNDHRDAIHYVNHSHQIDDHLLINEFDTEAKDVFYSANLETESCEDFLEKYSSCTNPYVVNEIFSKLFRANKVDESLKFARSALQYAFSSPNIYWNNKEAIYGSTNILYIIVEALSPVGISQLKDKSERIAIILVKTLFHLLSRIIYWTDMETYVDEKYNDNLMPINVQHKIRAYRLRSLIAKQYLGLLVTDTDEYDGQMMQLADLNSAHSMAFANGIVGGNSCFLRDALGLFHTSGLFLHGAIEQMARKGFEQNDSLSMSLHDEYKKGYLSLSQDEVSQLVGFLKNFFEAQNYIAVKLHQPLPYLLKDHFSPSYKSNGNEIKQYLLDNGISCFYHFTDEDRLESIKRHGGLMSYKRCLDEAVVMPVREDMARSRDIDAKYDLEDFARLSFCKRLPIIKERMKNGKELVRLKISIEVATFEDTEFTDMEATSIKMHHGNTFDDLRKVNLQATKNLVYERMSEIEYLQMQAEVLVKGFIPLKYIENVNNPEKITS